MAKEYEPKSIRPMLAATNEAIDSLARIRQHGLRAMKDGELAGSQEDALKQALGKFPDMESLLIELYRSVKDYED